MHDPCPSPTHLADLIAGRLPTSEHDRLEQHVLECAACHEALERLEEPRQDALLAELRAAADDRAPHEPEFHKAIARLKSSHPEKGAHWVPDRDPEVDSTLGDFRIVKVIGRGGMGVVYEALQISLARRVALKTLPFAPLLDQRRLERFQNEARAAASLRHPHIVDVYAVGVERGVHYYAMQLIEGKNLSQVISGLRESTRVSSHPRARKHQSLQDDNERRIPLGTTIDDPGRRHAVPYSDAADPLRSRQPFAQS